MQPIRSLLHVRYFRTQDGSIQAHFMRLKDDQIAALELSLDTKKHPKTNGWGPEGLQHLGQVARRMCATGEILMPNIVSVQYLLRDETKVPQFFGINMFDPEDRDVSPLVWYQKPSWKPLLFSVLKTLGESHSKVKYVREQWRTRVGSNGADPTTVFCIPKPEVGNVGYYTEVCGPYDLVVTE